MRHGYFGRKLSRTKNERRRLFMVLTRELIKRGKIRTTIAKAKAVQPLVEKLVSKAKSGSRSAVDGIHKLLVDKTSIERLLAWAPTRFSGRSSGFTRIVRLGQRVGDATEEVLLSFVDEAPVIEPSSEQRAMSQEKKQKTEAPKPKRKGKGKS